MTCRCIHYEADRVTVKRVDDSRMQLIEATEKVMQTCFYILGIKTLERM